MQVTTTGPIGGVSEEGAERIERLSSGAQDAVKRVAEATASTVREMGAKGEQLHRQWAQTQDYWMTSARDCVRTHPLASVAIAAGVGLLLSRLMSR